MKKKGKGEREKGEKRLKNASLGVKNSKIFCYPDPADQNETDPDPKY